MPRIQISGPSGQQDCDVFALMISIGRDATNAIALQDSELSRKHCVIEEVEGSWRVRDLGSRNGTKVNGASIASHALVNGDTVQIGSHTLRFVEEVVPRASSLSSPHPESSTREGPQEPTAAYQIAEAQDLGVPRGVRLSSHGRMQGYPPNTESSVGRSTAPSARRGGVKLVGGVAALLLLSGGGLTAFIALRSGDQTGSGFRSGSSAVEETRAPAPSRGPESSDGDAVLARWKWAPLEGLFIVDPGRGREASLVGVPGPANGSAHGSNRKVWTDFGEWYFAARCCGGIVFPDATSAGEAMYQVVDRSTPRGEALAMARRQVAEAEWRFTDSIVHTFPNMTEYELAILAEIVFGHGACFIPIADGRVFTTRESFVRQQVLDYRLERKGGNNSGGYGGEAEDFLDEDPNTTSVAPFLPGNDYQCWGLVLTRDGVRIDPFAGRAAHPDSDDYPAPRSSMKCAYRDPATGQLLKGIETAGAEVSVVLVAAQQWLQCLRELEAVLDVCKGPGGYERFEALLNSRDLHTIGRPHELERGWKFVLPALTN